MTLKAQGTLEERMGKMQHFLENKNLECLKCLILYDNLDLVILVAKIIIHLLTISSFVF